MANNTLVGSQGQVADSKHGGPGVDDLNNSGQVLYIEHVPSSTPTAKNFVTFPAFLDGFSDAYNSEWNSEQVFGRMDPIATFRHTRRAISVSWLIPAYSEAQASENLAKINLLLRFLYPLYEQRAGASTINMGPLLRVKFGNLIADGETGGPLLGYVNGFTMDPILEEGMFINSIGQQSSVAAIRGGSAEENRTTYLPKSVRLNFEMTVLHEHPVGWHKGEGDKYYFRGGNNGFPYLDSGASEGFLTPVQAPDPPKAVLTRESDATIERKKHAALQKKITAAGTAVRVLAQGTVASGGSVLGGLAALATHILGSDDDK